MADEPRVLGVIPARGGSKGLPGKNVRRMAGMPLIGHSIAAAELVPRLTRTVVSTDAPGIAAVARSLGGDVPFLRPGSLATDTTPMPPVLTHALDTLEAQDPPYQMLALLDPTSPARAPADVTRAIDLLDEHPGWDGVVSVSEPGYHPAWVGVRPATHDPATLTRYFPAGRGVTRRQEMEPFLRINGGVYVWRTDFLRQLTGPWIDEGVHGMVQTPELWAFAIDHLYQFEMLEALIAQGVIRLPWLEDDQP